MYREAAVLSHLGHHPCIVHFYGLVVEQLAAGKDSPPPALSGNSFSGMHDSAGSNGLHALGGVMPAAGPGTGKAGPRLSVGLVMELCDMSLQQWMRENPAPYPLRTAVHVGVCIAGGLKYLHEDAPITVVHAGKAHVSRQAWQSTYVCIHAPSASMLGKLGGGGAHHYVYCVQKRAPFIRYCFESLVR
jgi:serine/threonine protein kinase